ncbi:MAG TPA: serine/threonine-protein phosphatase, partial [Actinoplanes sp.]
MPTLPAGSRPLSPGSRAGLGAALLLLGIVSAVAFADDARANYVGLLAAVPFLAAALAFWPAVLLVGLLSTAVGLAFAVADGRLEMADMVNIAGVIVATCIASAVATIRQRQADRIVELSRLAAV